jgi:type I restriction enzyme S subunit
MAVANWQTAILGNFVTYQKGFAFKSSEYRPHGHPVVRVSNFTDRTIKMADCNYIDPENVPQYLNFALSTGDVVVIATVGSWPSNEASVVGKAVRVPPEADGALLNQNAVRLRGRGELNQRFLFYLLKTEHFQSYIVCTAQGSANQASITLRDIFGYEFPLPPLPEQRAIAHILGTLDDKIELNRRMNETLEAMARAIFKSWFVDFDPVRAKAEGHDPGLPKHIADLCPDRFQDSEVGEIPAGWEVCSIGQLADVVGGSTPSTANSEFWEGGTHCWATPKDLASLKAPVLLATERCVTDAGLAQISSGLLSAGTVLLSSRAPIGYLAVAEVSVAINQGFIAMKPKKGVPNLFLLLWARFAHEDILSRANGSTFLEISKASFRPIPLARSTDRVFDAFESFVRPRHQRIVNNERESRTLAALRDALLPKLISGELRVQDAERIIGSVI